MPDDPRDKLEEAKSKLEDLMLKGMEKALGTIELDAKRNAPVGPQGGALQAGITHKIENKDEEITGTMGVGGPASEYAVYVHQGTGIYAVNGDGRQDVPWHYKDRLTGEWHHTKGQKPQPFIQKAIDSNKDKIGEIFKEVSERIDKL